MKHPLLTIFSLPLLLAAGPLFAQQFPEAPNPLRQPPAAQQPAAQTPAQRPADAPVAAAEETKSDEDQGSQLGDTQGERLDKPQLDALRERVDTLSLTDDEKKSAKQFYQDALQATTELEKQQQLEKEKEAEYREEPAPDDLEGPPRNTKEWYQKRLAMPIEQELNLKPVDLKNDTTEYLEERAVGRESGANRWSKKVQELEGAPTKRKQWLSDLPAKRQAIEQKLAEATDKIKEIDQGDLTNEVTAARRAWRVQQVAKLNAELAALQAQREAYVRAEPLYDLELELSKKKAAKYQEVLAQVRNELSERRKRAADEQALAAQREADRNKQLLSRNTDTLGALSDYNQALTKDLQELVTARDTATARRDMDNEANNSITATFDKFKTQFGEGEKLSQASGQMLREQRSKLPRVTRLKNELARRQNERSDLSFRRFEATGQLDELQDLDAAVAKKLSSVNPADRDQAAPVVRRLLENQVEYLKSYVADVEGLDSDLAELITVKTQLIKSTEEFREFIAQRDLWVRSCRPLWAAKIEPGHSASSWRPFYLKPAMGAMTWSFHPANWLQMLSDLQQAAVRQPFTAAMLIVAFGLLLFAQHEARSRIRLLGQEAAKKTCVDFFPSLRAVWLTAIVSLPWPLLLWSVGWLLESPLVDSEFTRALSQSTRVAAWVLLLTELLRQSCRTSGLAEAHLGWPRATLLQLRRYLRWAPVVIVPLVFWQAGLEIQTTQPLWGASLGRVLFIVLMLLYAWVLYRLLMVKKSAMYQAIVRDGDNWLMKLHVGWRPVLVVLPIALAGLASVGYYYTAEQLALRMLATATMLLLLMIAGGLLRRWVLLNRRQLAREQARQRRAQAQAAAEAAAAAAAEGEAPPMPPITEFIEETVDLTALSEQTRKLLHMVLLAGGVLGAIAIWQSIFPALAWLDHNPLPGLTGDNPMNWGNLIRCLVALLVTYLAARDLPGLLELVVLQHLPIDQGVRYATTTLVRYAILTFGLVVAAAALGITPTSISWLVAAMGVGLGFGLQEIFANFVSGIILLFERPIRVGDIITLGEKTGVVSRIRMRATTITDWDRKEYVVPNKDLVTERLLNWTLSDLTNRITLEVGVAYGSDTERACALLREVVTDHPVVLDDPVPIITFEGFGDSTLNLVLRCYLPDLEKRLLTIHDLHTAIDKKFKAAGIEIAFPQRDLHIRTMPPEWLAPTSSSAAESNGHQETRRPAEIN